MSRATTRLKMRSTPTSGRPTWIRLTSISRLVFSSCRAEPHTTAPRTARPRRRRMCIPMHTKLLVCMGPQHLSGAHNRRSSRRRRKALHHPLCLLALLLRSGSIVRWLASARTTSLPSKRRRAMISATACIRAHSNTRSIALRAPDRNRCDLTRSPSVRLPTGQDLPGLPTLRALDPSAVACPRRLRPTASPPAPITQYRLRVLLKQARRSCPLTSRSPLIASLTPTTARMLAMPRLPALRLRPRASQLPLPRDQCTGAWVALIRPRRSVLLLKTVLDRPGTVIQRRTSTILTLRPAVALQVAHPPLRRPLPPLRLLLVSVKESASVRNAPRRLPANAIGSGKSLKITTRSVRNWRRNRIAGVLRPQLTECPRPRCLGTAHRMPLIPAASTTVTILRRLLTILRRCRR